MKLFPMFCDRKYRKHVENGKFISESGKQMASFLDSPERRWVHGYWADSIGIAAEGEQKAIYGENG